MDSLNEAIGHLCTSMFCGALDESGMHYAWFEVQGYACWRGDGFVRFPLFKACLGGMVPNEIEGAKILLLFDFK